MKQLDNVSDVALKKIRDYVGGPKTPWTDGGIAAFQFFDRQTGEAPKLRGYYNTYPTGMAPCHNYVQCLDNEGIVVNATKPSLGKKFGDFIKWLCNESPYAYAVMNADDEEEILNRGVVIDVALCGRGGALWLCKAMRNMSEVPHVVEVWQKLVAEGVDPLWAFVGGAILTRDGSPNFSTYHGAAFHYSTPEHLFKWVKKLKKGEKNTTNVTALPTLPAQYEPGTYRPLPRPVWGSMKGKTVRKPDGWGGYSEVIEMAGAAGYAEIINRIAKEGKL